MEKVEIKIDKEKGHTRAGRVFAGLIVIGVGIVLFMKQMGTIFPEWLFTWEMLVIVFGVFIGAKHSFRNPGWLIPVLIGGVFLIDNFIPEFNLTNYVWPIVIIIAGLMMVFIPGRRRRCRNRHYRHHRRWERWQQKKYGYMQNPEEFEKKPIGEDMIETTSIMGNVKKVVLSKDFKGGELVAVLGGIELGLSQADINGRVVLDVTAVLGGIMINVPPHWEIQSEMTAVMGGIEDKRMQDQIIKNPDKLLVIKGTCVLGGIELRSF